MMRAKTEIQKQLLTGINEITSRQVGPNDNLLAGAVDSLAWVELINLVDLLAQKKSLNVDLESLLTRKELTINVLLQILNEESLP